MKKKVGFFGGSFDPIHLGHLNLALQIKESLSLEEILWVPAFCSPTRLTSPPVAEPHHRLKMVQEAIQAIEGFTCLDFEVKRKKPSYTIDTLRFLEESLSKDTSLFLLLSEEAYLGFSHWKEAEEMEKKVTLVSGKRECHKKNASKESSLIRVENKVMEISSTDIRKRLQENKYVGHLLPYPVLAYIKKHGLYKGSL